MKIHLKGRPDVTYEVLDPSEVYFALHQDRVTVLVLKKDEWEEVPDAKPNL